MSRFAPGTTEISNAVLAEFLLHEFRYCLGRMTYVVSTCRERLERYWDLLPRDWQVQIHRDIADAIDKGRAGHACDMAEWRKVLALPVKESTTPTTETL